MDEERPSGWFIHEGRAHYFKRACTISLCGDVVVVHFEDVARWNVATHCGAIEQCAGCRAGMFPGR